MKIALLQHSFQGSVEATIAHTTAMVREASRGGAKLVVLQELHTNAYFCQNEDVVHFQLADECEKHQETFASLAKECGVVLVTSLFEKAMKGVYFNTAFVFEADGSLAGKYRKMHIPDDPNFYEKFYFTPGDLGFNPINTSVGKLGVLICWDQWFFEPARIMALKGADILIYPTAIGFCDEENEAQKQSALHSWINIQKAHSIGNHLPVVAVNRVGHESDPSGSTEGISFWGNSFVTNARGEIVAQASGDKDEIIYSQIDYEQTTNVRTVWPFFRDRRVEYYQDLQKIISE